MAEYRIASFQIGKNGLTEGVLESLDLILKNHKQVRVSILKSATRDREEIKSFAEQIQEKLKTPVTTRILGYTIIVIRNK